MKKFFMKLAYTILPIALLLLSSCVTYDKCLHKFSAITDTVVVIDTLYNYLEKDTNYVVIHDTVKHYTRETERTILSVKRDSVYTYIECEAKQDTITNVVEKVIHNNVYKDKRNILMYVVISIVATLVIVIIVLKLIK